MPRRRDDRWAPPPRGAKPPTEPVEPIDLYPNPLPPPGPPVTRESTLADLQTGFASLTDEELKVARLWLVGESLDDICYLLNMREKAVKALWQRMRGKVRFALLDEAERTFESPLPATPIPPSSTGTPQETEGTSPA